MTEFTSVLIRLADELSGHQTAIREDTSLINRLATVNQQRTKLLQARKLPKRFSPSQMSRMCQQKEVLKRLDGTRYDAPVNTAKQAQAQVDLGALGMAGSVLHETLQNQEFAHIPGLLWGRWFHRPTKTWYGPCTNTDLPLPTTPARPERWHRELSRRWRYEELKIVLDTPDNEGGVLPEDYAISAKIDGILLEDNGWKILEIKTVASDFFHGYRRTSGPEPGQQVLVPSPHAELPRRKDVFQARLYAAIVDEALRTGVLTGLDRGACKGVIVLYVARDNPAERKEFELPPDTTALRAQQQQIQFINFLVRQNQPDLAVKKCSSRTSQDALFCPFRYHCFPSKRDRKTQQHNGKA